MKCCRCKRDLPEEMFYPSDKYRCRDCHKEMRRQQHYNKVKHLFGISRNEKGQLLEYQNHKKSIYWTGNMLSIMNRYYPSTPNAELVELLNVSERTITRKAKELGLSKSKEYISIMNTGKSMLGTIKRYYDKPKHTE